MTDKLTTKHKLFCEYFTGGAETCGNGVQSYALAYGYDISNRSKYNSAKANAHKLLANPTINSYISDLLKAKKLTPEFVDNQLDFLISQSTNFNVKLQAIVTYYKFRMRVADDNSQSKLLSKRAAEMAKDYMDSEVWEKKYGHYFTPTQLEEYKKQKIYT